MTILSLSGVGLTYPGPPPIAALRPCDVVVEDGEYVTIVGPSGSGKSTLLNVFGLLDRPTEGRYELAGHDTVALPDRDRTALRARYIGFVFQSFQLLPYYSAVENVALGLTYGGVRRRERERRARDALAQVGLTHRESATPGTLSGGERQRVAIARALVVQPKLLLCDEPTGNLDSVSAAAVLDLIDELRTGGLTVLMITHDASVAARGTRTLSISDGTVTAA